MPRESQKGKVRATILNVPLDCGHLAQYKGMPPHKGETVYCRKCGDYTEVMGDVPTPYRLICNGCSYNRQYGADKTLALRKANAHLIRFHGHTLTLWQGGDEIETLRNENVSLFLTNALLDANRTHQSGLKNLGKLGGKTVADLEGGELV